MERYGITYGQYIDKEKMQQAKALRKTMTKAERVFWEHVRRRRYPGYRFRRQQVIDGFIVDFYCSKLRLAIEIDGEVHNDRKIYDRDRDAILEQHGIKVLRFSNTDVIHDIEKVMWKVFTFKTPPT